MYVCNIRQYLICQKHFLPISPNISLVNIFVLHDMSVKLIFLQCGLMHHECIHTADNVLSKHTSAHVTHATI